MVCIGICVLKNGESILLVTLSVLEVVHMSNDFQIDYFCSRLEGQRSTVFKRVFSRCLLMLNTCGAMCSEFCANIRAIIRLFDSPE